MWKHLLVLIIVCWAPFTGHARLLQIIHTNDLHSFFDGTRSGRGGYARIKTLMEGLRQSAKAQGISSITLDAGDFGEGSSYFLSNEGVDAFRALDLLGIDVTVLGNHDYMQGGDDLARQIRNSGMKTRVLSANLTGKKRLGLKGLVDSHADLNVEGMKIRIFGLSTNEIHFQYPVLRKGFLRNPMNVIKREERLARKSNADLVIALTHIGLEKDVKLVGKSKTIDLVIGGHSHTRLSTPLFIPNKSGRLVPIAQTGAHGLAVGEFLVDVQPNGRSEVISYQLHEVTPAIEKDMQMSTFTKTAHDNREKYFGRSWDEIIGETLVPLTGYVDGVGNTKISCWGMHMARMTRDHANAQIGLHYSNFEGEEIAPGLITFGDMIDNFPHFRNFGDKGWQIAVVRLNGLIIKKVIAFLMSDPHLLGFNLYGLEIPSLAVPVVPFDNEKMAGQITINGEPIKNTKSYTLAFPSEVAHTLERTIPILTNLIFPSLRRTGKYYWEHIEQYMKDNSPIHCDEQFNAQAMSN